MTNVLKYFVRTSYAGLTFNNITCLKSGNVQRIHRWVAPTLKVLKIRKDKEKPKPPAHRNTFLEWNYNAELYSFGKRLGEEFNSDLLRQALTHRSYIILEEEKQKEVGIENQDLSFSDNSKMIEEGEQIMSEYIQSYLRVVFPRVPEEGISSIHDYLMSEEILAHISLMIGTSELVLCQEFPVEKETLAKTLKALVSCLAKSSGLNKANLFVRDFVLPQLAAKDINGIWCVENPHEVLSTILKNEGKPEPEPRLIGDSAKNTFAANFRVGLYINKEYLSVGCGETVDTAHEMAAYDALKQYFGTTDRDRAIPFDLDLEKIKVPTKNLSIKDWSTKKFI